MAARRLLALALAWAALPWSTPLVDESSSEYQQAVHEQLLSAASLVGLQFLTAELQGTSIGIGGDVITVQRWADNGGASPSGVNRARHAASIAAARTAADQASAAAPHDAAGSGGGAHGDSEAGGSGDARSYAALCAITRDQHDDLIEWVTHHLSLGLRPVYLFDDKSDPPLMGKLLRYIRAGDVVYHYMYRAHAAYRGGGGVGGGGAGDSAGSGGGRGGGAGDADGEVEQGAMQHEQGGPQTWVYNFCTRNYGARHQWVAFFDTDEFLMFTDGRRDAAAFLRGYEQYAGLAVTWWEYGSEGHVLKPQAGGVVGNYRHCRRNSGAKTIANMEAITHWKHSHHPEHVRGRPIVDEAGLKVRGPTNGHKSSDTVFLAHYVTKSEQHFWEKMRRGYGNNNITRGPDMIQTLDMAAARLCNESLAYALPAPAP